jgi:hypothetical protein
MFSSNFYRIFSERSRIDSTGSINISNFSYIIITDNDKNAEKMVALDKPKKDIKEIIKEF